MEAIRRFVAIVRADARQRWRAPRLAMAVLMLIALTALCFPAADAPYRVLGVGPFRVAYASAWVGMVVAMLMTWLSLIGFFLVRGTLARDIDTRCWELLVATPLSRAGYLVAKWLSHLLVLLAIALGMLAMGAIAVALRAPEAAIEPLQLLLPTLVLGVPALAICALCAVLFDLVPLLRRTLGNALYVVLWIGMLAAGAAGGGDKAPASLRLGDVHGIAVFKRDLATVAATQNIDTTAERICLLCGSAASATVPIRWTHWSPARSDLPGRLFWLLLPLPLLAVAARGLDRAARTTTRSTGARVARRLGWLRFLFAPLQGRGGTALLSLELQQALRERPLWLWAALPIAWGAQLFAAAGVASLAVITAWALFLPVFSHAALREREFATMAVMFSSVGATARLLRVRVLGLLSIGFLCAAPAVLRFALGEPLLGLALLGLIASLAAWALALGALSGSARPFELLFVLAALLALNGIGVLDPSIAPLSTLLAHLALLPVALFLLAFAWPRLTRAAGRS